MKIFLLILVLFAFIQSATLSMNLVAVFLIARCLVVQYQENYWLAFFSGLILSYLTQVNLGYWPLVLLLIVKLAHLLKSLPVAFNFWVTFAIGSLLVLFIALINSLLQGDEISFFTLCTEAVLIIPAYILVKIWEERFDRKSVLRLKV